MSAPEVVLLWDLDGTLLSTGRAGVFALEEAAEAVLGTGVDLQDMHTSGLTDAQIAELILDRHGHGLGDVNRFLALYGDALPRHLPRRQGRVMPGVRALLEDLAPEDLVVSLLLTGNTRAGAQAKLRHYGLADLIIDGAFCRGPGERTVIARAALEEAERRLGSAPDPDRTYVIGDTPLDIECALALGLRSIGVATGEYGVDELERSGAWRALEHLPKPAEFRTLVGLPAGFRSGYAPGET
jgi:phosphoglycolate phosphatase-like HAD superfamily hydrolase